MPSILCPPVIKECVAIMAVNPPKTEAFWAIWTQAAFVVLAFIMGIIIWEKQAALSLAYGSLVCVLPNFYLYRKLFSHFGARKAPEIVKGFYLGEAGKIVF